MLSYTDVPPEAINAPLREQIGSRHKRNTLPRKIESNSIGAIVYRADYELRWLRQAKKARLFWTPFLCSTALKRALKGVPADVQEITAAVMHTVQAAQIASRELREWSEREAELLNIGKPARRTTSKIKSSMRLDRDNTPTMLEADMVQTKVNAT